MPYKLNPLTGKFDYYETGSGSPQNLSQVLTTGNSAGNQDVNDVDKIDFNLATTDIAGEGQLVWNNQDGTLDLGLKGGNTILNVGQENIVRVVNKTTPLVPLTKAGYQAVVVSGATGQRLSVKLAKADSDINSAGTLGLVSEDIAVNQEGFITTVGVIKDVNTTGALQGETWNDGDVLYLSPTTAGAITNVKPTAPNHLVVIGYVEYKHAVNGKIYVKVDNGYELNELHDVAYPTTPANNEVLVYSSTNSRWENKKLQLSDVLLSGNSAGSTSINLNNQDLTNTDKISFNTATIDTGGVAQLKWNDNDGTLDLGLKGGNVNLQIGQESVIRVNNQTSPAITLNEADYQAVIVTGAVAGKLAVKLAQANSDINSFTTIGIVTETILHSSEGFITTYGLVRGINTTGSLQGETWVDGDILYLSPTVLGGITKVRPISPNNIITIGYVAFAHGANGSIFVKVDNLGYISSGNNFIINSSTQWSRTLAAPLPFNNATIANGFTFFDDTLHRVASGCTSYNEFFINFGRRLTLTGTSGTANINIGGVDYLATFATSLTQTAINFVATHGAAIKAASGVQVFANAGVLRFGHPLVATVNAITITNVTTNLSGTFDTAIGDHVIIPYIGQPYEGLRLNHQFRVNFNLSVGASQTVALSLRRWSDDSIIGSEIQVDRNPDVAGVQENFISYTAGANDPFVTGGFYFAARNDSGVNLNIEGTVGVLIITTFQKPVNF